MEKADLNQVTKLREYFYQEQLHGGYAELDLTNVDWYEMTERQRARLWYLIFTHKKDELIKTLWSMGATAQKE